MVSVNAGWPRHRDTLFYHRYFQESLALAALPRIHFLLLLLTVPGPGQAYSCGEGYEDKATRSALGFALQAHSCTTATGPELYSALTGPELYSAF